MSSPSVSVLGVDGKPLTPSRARKLLAVVVGARLQVLRRWFRRYPLQQELGARYGYRKTRVKSAAKFTAPCSDSLTYAVAVSRTALAPGRFRVVKDTYHPGQRRLHDTQPATPRTPCPLRGTGFGVRKGTLVGPPKGGIGQ